MFTKCTESLANSYSHACINIPKHAQSDIHLKAFVTKRDGNTPLLYNDYCRPHTDAAQRKAGSARIITHLNCTSLMESSKRMVF